MTDTEHIANLESRLAKLEAFFLFKVNPYDGTIGVMTNGRFGVMTEFWMNQPTGQGAALSVGTITDRFAIYGEIDKVACPNHPSTAIYAAAVAPNPFGQKNIAVEAHAAGSSPAISLYADGDGIELGPNVLTWFIGKLGGVIKELWP